MYFTLRCAKSGCGVALKRYNRPERPAAFVGSSVFFVFSGSERTDNVSKKMGTKPEGKANSMVGATEFEEE